VKRARVYACLLYALIVPMGAVGASVTISHVLTGDVSGAAWCILSLALAWSRVSSWADALLVMKGRRTDD
jgi:hypothetical protein